MKTFLLASFALLTLNAQAAYREGSFHCKSSGGENTYTVQNVSVGGVTVPYVEAVLRYHQDISNPNSPVQESVVKGFAADSSSGNETTLMVAALRLEFENGELLNCKH